jgi:hypothetical protein
VQADLPPGQQAQADLPLGHSPALTASLL